MAFTHIMVVILALGGLALSLVLLVGAMFRVVGPGSRALCVILDGLAVAARRNMPIPVALRMLAEDSPHAFKRRLDMAAMRAAGGDPLGDALECLGAKLPKSYTTAISACERQGGLADVLEGLARCQAARTDAKQATVFAAAYPALITLLSSFWIGAIAVFIVPKFEAMFREMGVELPGLTQWLVFGSKLLGGHFGYVALAALPVLAAFVLAYFLFVYRWPLAALSAPVDYLLFAAPGLRRFLLYRSIETFARSLGVALRAGAPLPDALRAVADVDLPYPLRRRVARVAWLVEEGHPFAASLREVGLVPRNFVWLVGLGEESGQLDDACLRAADMYQSRAEQFLRYATAMVFPCAILAVGAVEAFIVLGMFMPLIMLASSIG